MDITTFLEKKEKLQLQIIRKLMGANQNLPFKQLTTELSLTNVILESSIEELNNHGQLAHQDFICEICNDGPFSVVTLSIPPDFDLAILYQNYLRETIYYKMILYLFNNKQFVLSKMAQDLFISEASLFRKLKQLNQYLEDFDIQFKQGKFEGSELKIRYFFFQFFWCSSTYQELAQLFSNSNSQAFITLLMQRLDLKLSETNFLKLLIWSQISVQRSKLFDAPTALSFFWPAQLKAMHKNKTFQIIESLFSNGNCTHMTNRDDFEVVNLYLFISSMHIFDNHHDNFHKTRELWESPFEIVTKQNHIFVDEISDLLNVEIISEHFIDYLEFHLTQIHTQMLFFNGTFLLHDINKLKALESDLNFQSIIDIRDKILQKNNQILKNKKIYLSTDLLTQARWRYNDLLTQFQWTCRQRINVGLFFHIDSCSTNSVQHRLNVHFGHKFNLKIEPANTHTVYDLLLCDSTFEIARYQFKNKYLTSQIETPYNLEQIQLILNKLC